MDVQVYKEALLKKRSEILGAGGIKPLQASMENNTRQGDMADQASGNNEVHIQLKLKQTDAKILRNIEEALWRIEHGTYGVCRECGEPFASELQVGDLKDILPEVGFDYSLDDGGNWQDVCPRCRRRLFRLAQRERVGGLG